MNRLAILFSGQGGQAAGHWTFLHEQADAEIAEALVRCLPGWSAGCPPTAEQLAGNALAQPLIVAQQMLLWSRLAGRLPKPVCLAGYSLGELSACAAAAGLAPATAIALAAERARLMDAAAPGDYGMIAVLGLSESTVVEAAAILGLEMAIRNGPAHFVLAGPLAGLPVAEAAFAARGASRVSRLAVRTPSHTSRLAAATPAFAAQLAGLPAKPLSFPVLSAVDAVAHRHTDRAFPALARQLSSRLDWAGCLNAVRELQPDAVLEIGPGNALARMWEELDSGIPARASDDFRTLDGLLGWLNRVLAA
ncbi:acyltransferase domain-containing protein [Azonexus sp. R2A61]|uniref:acyltransferase domain-containing protein n=1 Tax=Azonexus sp. R2A61 TaxID=2744443 RepID=UPI001F29F6D3